jgi:hypothetical protein
MGEAEIKVNQLYNRWCNPKADPNATEASMMLSWTDQQNTTQLVELRPTS